MIRSRSAALAALILSASAAPLPAQPAQAPATVTSSAGPVVAETVARLSSPWGLAFLPDGRMLVTERLGQLKLVTRDGKVAEVAGAPKVRAQGQGGLLDIALDRGFDQNRMPYLCYAEEMPGGGRTAMASARLSEDASALSDFKVIFRQEGPPTRGNHYGCRIAQGADGNLFLGMGDHSTHREEAQNLANHLGKIVRVRPDGTVPDDNPFVKDKAARPEIWSYGHRNIQGMTLDPASGALWATEHGPRGGDELNRIEPGKNYGWPVIGYGMNYDGSPAHRSTHRDGMEQPVKQWTPVIAASGLAVYRGDLFPAWKGQLFAGGLAGKVLVRLDVRDGKVAGEERLLQELNERIRDVRAGPDGALWVLTDGPSGRLLRLAPAS